MKRQNQRAPPESAQEEEEGIDARGSAKETAQDALRSLGPVSNWAETNSVNLGSSIYTILALTSLSQNTHGWAQECTGEETVQLMLTQELIVMQGLGTHQLVCAHAAGFKPFSIGSPRNNSFGQHAVVYEVCSRRSGRLC